MSAINMAIEVRNVLPMIQSPSSTLCEWVYVRQTAPDRVPNRIQPELIGFKEVPDATKSEGVSVRVSFPGNLLVDDFSWIIAQGNHLSFSISSVDGQCQLLLNLAGDRRVSVHNNVSRRKRKVEQSGYSNSEFGPVLRRTHFWNHLCDSFHDSYEGDQRTDFCDDSNHSTVHHDDDCPDF
jgi:hypothetical protein